MANTPIDSQAQARAKGPRGFLGRRPLGASLSKAPTGGPRHGSIGITFDKYGHMFAGHEDAAGALLAAFYGGQTADVVSLPARRAA